MKRFLIVIFLLPLVVVFIPAKAQNQEEAMQQMLAQLPTDPAVRVGPSGT